MEKNCAFVSASDRAQRTIAFFYLMMAFDGLGGGLTLCRLVNAPGSEVGFVEGIASIFHFVVFVLLIVFFCQWMHRAYSNLPALGAKRLRFSPGWSIGNFFVPFINLVYPLYAMREIWHISNPSDRQHRSHPDRWPVPLLGSWWACWLLMSLIGNVSFRMTVQGKEVSTIIAGEWLGVISSVFSIPAALLAIAVVRRIDEFQTQKFMQPPVEQKA